MNLTSSKSDIQINNVNLINIPSIEGNKITNNNKQQSSSPSVGKILLPAEANELPVECKDLLLRLTKYNPDERIRSIFAIQRTAMFKGFNFEQAKRKEVRNKNSKLIKCSFEFHIFFQLFFFPHHFRSIQSNLCYQQKAFTYEFNEL